MLRNESSISVCFYLAMILFPDVRVRQIFNIVTNIEYNLVCELGRLDAPGRPLLFGTTEEFLRRFSVQSLDDLPGIEPEKLETFKEEAEDEAQIRLNI